MKKALTISEVARLLGCSVFRADYYIRSRKIAPVETAGRLRIFDKGVIERLRQEMRTEKTKLDNKQHSHIVPISGYVA